MGEPRVVAIHSYRGGTGKSSTTANLAACCLARGKRVAVLDTDLQSPGIHVLFGFNHKDVKLTLVDFLWNRCDITETVYDVTPRIDPEAEGKLFLVPASMNTQAISRILDEGYDVNRLNEHFDALIESFDLDVLFIDTHPGLNKETMLTAAISDVLILIVRPDQQDYYGTAVLKEIADKLEIPNVFVLVNKFLSHMDEAALTAKLREAFGFDVLGMIPLSEDVARLESRALITRKNPDHPISHLLARVADRVLEAPL